MWLFLLVFDVLEYVLEGRLLMSIVCLNMVLSLPWVMTQLPGWLWV